MSAKIHQYAPTTSTNGNSTDKSKQLSYQRSAWERIKDILPHREDLVVAGREVKGGIVIHPVIASAILGAIVLASGAIYRSISTELAWQHDQLITLAAQKDAAEKAQAKSEQQLGMRLQNIDAVQIVLGRDIAKLQEAQKLQESKGRN